MNLLQQVVQLSPIVKKCYDQFDMWVGSSFSSYHKCSLLCVLLNIACVTAIQYSYPFLWTETFMPIRGCCFYVLFPSHCNRYTILCWFFCDSKCTFCQRFCLPIIKIFSFCMWQTNCQECIQATKVNKKSAHSFSAQYLQMKAIEPINIIYIMLLHTCKYTILFIFLTFKLFVIVHALNQ